MRIAVTGSTGMIGTELVNVVLKEGHEVIAIIRPNSKRKSNIPDNERVTIIECEMTDYEKIFDYDRCDMFFHLAWKEVFGAKRDDVFIQNENIKCSLDAVTLANNWGAKKFVGAGSQAEYGLTNEYLTSKTPTNPESGYGIAKYAAGKLCKLYCDQNNIDFNWGRITSTYGELDTETTLIMYLINSLLDGKSPELTKCEQMWDYTYSKDMARALYLIGIKGINGKTYSLGSGDHRQLKEYVTEIRDLINPKIELQFGKKQYYPHQPMFLCSDISELTKDTGFVPEYSFKAGISNVIDYLRDKKTATNFTV